jgi:ABC-2 type transport system permease protein
MDFNMTQLLQIARYEYRMSIRRWGIWLAFGLVAGFYAISFIMTPGDEDLPIITTEVIWQSAGQIAFFLNVFLPVVAGIAASDRLVRDMKLGVAELQSSSPLSRWTYLLSKYAAVLAAVLTPVLLFNLVVAGLSVILYPGMPLTLLPVTLLAFLAINLPAYAFLTIFSLACPLIMPLRVYQVLFTGYWFWGNFLNPDVFPSLSDTLLAPSGKYVMQAFFGNFISVDEPLHSTTDAVLNLLVLAGCILAAMLVTKIYLDRKTRRA